MLRRTGKKACESESDDKDDSTAHSTAPLAQDTGKAVRGRSLDVLNQHARLPHQRPQLPAFLDGFARIQAVVVTRNARSRRTTMHSATREHRVPRSLPPSIYRPQYSSMRTAAVARACGWRIETLLVESPRVSIDKVIELTTVLS